MRKFFLICSALAVFLQSVEGSAAAVYGQPVRGYSSSRLTQQSTSPQRKSSLGLPRNIEAQHYSKIIDYLYADDYVGLRSAQESGLNINARNRQDDTAMCTSVKSKRYRWFSILRSAGADIGAICMKKIDEETKKDFIAEYETRGGYLTLSAKEEMLVTSSSVDWLAVGSVVGGVALVGGATALALSGGGGSSSKETSSGSARHRWSSSDEPTSGAPVSYPKNPAISDKTNPAYYQTAEFGGSNFTKAQNFLGQIYAQYAYAHAASEGGKVAGDGIIIGEVDTGIDYTHPELSNQIATDTHGNKLGINFHYGPCRGTDRKNCWLVDTSTGKARFYGNSGTVTTSLTLDATWLDAWNEYEATFPDDYNWDENKYNMVIYGDPVTHGTHVAGIMAAQKDGVGMHGVAYNAKIIGAAIDLGWLNSGSDVANAYRYLVDNGAKIINNSWGPTDEMSSNVVVATYDFNRYPTVKSAVSYAKANSVISVFAAGNEAFNYNGYEHLGYYKNPMNANSLSGAPMAIPSMLYYWDDNYNLQEFSSYPSDENTIASSLFITVVSVNDNNEIAYYSQKCGPAAKWCIAAPGGEKRETHSAMASTVGDVADSSGYANYQGTSMAAPVVSSALAVIMAAYPSLTPQEVVALLFETAIDLGNEDLYGHGLVNLKGAMEPVGTLTLATGNTTSEKVALSNTRVVLPHSFEVSTDIPVEIMVMDKYKRGFKIPSSKLVRSTTHSKQAFANDLRLFTKSRRKQKTDFSDQLSFSFSDTKSPFDTDTFAGKTFNLTWHDEDKIEVGISFTSDNTLAERQFVDKDLNNPFTSSMSDVYSLSNKLRLSDDLKLSVSGSVGKNNFFDGNERIEQKNDDTTKSMQFGMVYQPFKKVSFNLTAGLLNEKSSVLGLSGYGAFETKGSDTYFTGIEVSLLPFDKWHIDLSYYRGYTKGQKQNAFMSISDLETESFGINSAYDLTDELQVGMNFSSPLRVRKGYMDFDLPVARSDTGDIVYRENVKADLSPKARQFNYGLYAIKQTDFITLQGMGQVRIHPEHNAALKPDYRLMLGFALNY